MGEAWACLLLRLWVGMRLFFAGITKWKGKTAEGVIEFKGEYMKTKMDAIGQNMIDHTPIPGGMINMYTSTLPYLLVAVGALIIVGIFTRLSLIAGGLLFISLAFGLMLLPDDTESIYRGIEIAMVAGALALCRYNILSVDNVIGLAYRQPSGDSEKSSKDKDDS